MMVFVICIVLSKTVNLIYYIRVLSRLLQQYVDWTRLDKYWRHWSLVAVGCVSNRNRDNRHAFVRRKKSVLTKIKHSTIAVSGGHMTTTR